MTYEGAGPTRQNRSHKAASSGKAAVPNGVHTKLNSMQPRVRDPTLDLSASDAQRYELTPSDNSVLPGRELRDRDGSSTWSTVMPACDAHR